MDKAVFEYKCRRCGAVYEEGETSVTIAKQCMVGIVIGHTPSLMIGMPPEKLGIHSCEDGGEGISDCIGFKVEGLR